MIWFPLILWGVVDFKKLSFEAFLNHLLENVCNCLRQSWRIALQSFSDAVFLYMFVC